MKIYLVRHGETVFNTMGVLQGWNNSDLTEKGIEVAKNLGEELADVKFDKVFSSDLKRAADTARLIVNREPETTELLREIDMGDWSGRHISEVIENDGESYYNFCVNAHLYNKEGAESYTVFLDRLKNFIDNYLIGKDYKNVLITTHGVTCVGILAIAEGLPLEKLWDNRVPQNAVPSILKLEGGKLSVIEKAPPQTKKEDFEDFIKRSLKWKKKDNL